MNIFVLDIDPTEAAIAQCDKHVVKMPLECAQMLSTVHHIYESDRVDEVYKPTHRHHPCTVWAATTRSNYYWLYDHFEALSGEYRYRYGNTHQSWFKLREPLRHPPTGLRGVGLTTFAQAMPDEYKCDDAVAAYQSFYRSEKKSFLVYSKRMAPDWLTEPRTY